MTNSDRYAMTKLYPSPTLLHLRQRSGLDATLARLGEHDLTRDQLSQLARSKEGVDADTLTQQSIEVLWQHGLVQRHPNKFEHALPFYFVRAINIEVSYYCNLACSHCLQDGIRPAQAQWIDSNHIIRTLEEAKWLDLISSGVNITGGEAFLPDSPLLSLLAAANRMNIPTRANTNAWWGNASHIVIGQQHFDDDQAVIDALQAVNLGVLALSLDNRYLQYPALIDRVIRVAALCEQAKQDYEFVATEPHRNISLYVQQQLAQQLGHAPKHMSISQMEKVDMGAAQPSMHNTLDTNTLLPLIKGSSCEGKGFYRPFYLHLSPNGGLRNCMYAPNGGWLGNIQTSSLTSILNSISDNPVYRTFVDEGALEVFIDAYITPWQDGYRNIENGCTASAMVARVIEEVHQISQDSQTPSAQQMAEIHDSVRRQYRLG